MDLVIWTAVLWATVGLLVGLVLGWRIFGRAHGIAIRGEDGQDGGPGGGRGGNGGSAYVAGKGSVAIGGRGGDGGRPNWADRDAHQKAQPHSVGEGGGKAGT